jgi:hypothetical protein
LVLLLRSTESIEAENVFSAASSRCTSRARRAAASDRCSDRVSLAVLARLFDWRGALVVVQPATMIRWHRAGWRLLWRVKSRPGRPPIPEELRALIRRIAIENHRLWAKSG